MPARIRPLLLLLYVLAVATIAAAQIGNTDGDAMPPPPPQSAQDGVGASATDHMRYLNARIRKLEADLAILAPRARAAEAAHAATKQQLLDSHAREKRLQTEIKTQLEERKRAFDELLGEKQLLLRVVKDEQKQLDKLQKEIQNPNLALWLRRRAERVRILLDSPETDAMAYYAHLYMQPKITKMRHKLATLERSVEKTVDHLLPARYGAWVAVFMSFALVAFPLAVVAHVMLSLSRTISLRQYVFLCNVFLCALAFALVIARFAIGQDPLQTLYEASENVFIILQCAIAVCFPAFMLLLLATTVRGRRQGDWHIFACEFVFYAMVGLNYRRRVWQPCMLGENIHTNTPMYLVYLVDFACMTVLTMSAAKDARPPGLSTNDALRDFAWPARGVSKRSLPISRSMSADSKREQ